MKNPVRGTYRDGVCTVYILQFKNSVVFPMKVITLLYTHTQHTRWVKVHNDCHVGSCQDTRTESSSPAQSIGPILLGGEYISPAPPAGAPAPRRSALARALYTARSLSGNLAHFGPASTGMSRIGTTLPWSLRSTCMSLMNSRNPFACCFLLLLMTRREKTPRSLELLVVT